MLQAMGIKKLKISWKSLTIFLVSCPSLITGACSVAVYTGTVGDPAPVRCDADLIATMWNDHPP